PLVHHITDSLSLERVDFPPETLQALIRTLKIGSELGWQIDINYNPLSKMLVNLATQVNITRTRTFPTFDDAVAFLKEHDQTLVNLRWKTELVKSDETIPLRHRMK
ncbi:MAG TPA: hypothetical protein VHL11_02050, partial [Phototrophicaceae bacterium]|nr:hypothetical protein [Phototrophicaceae bacterium]